MNISGMRPSQGFYSYNTVKINNLRNQQIAAAKQMHQEQQQNDVAPSDSEDARKKQTFSSFDFAQTYRPDVEYELKGKDSDVTSLDYARPISETEVEKAIKDYKNFAKENVGGVSHQLENFAL